MSDTRHYLVTTPIYYVNGVPHVGHAYTTIAADTLARARRLAGHEVFLLTGTDEHGQNIERIARERGIPEQQHCDEIAAEFRALWALLDVRYDRFIRTTEDEHRRGVLKLWALLREAKTPDGRDAVYQGTYSGWYCPRCEAFKDEDELRQPDNVCPDHELPCEWTEEQNFFFRLSAYEEWLREEISTDRLLIRPETRRNEILGVIRQGLRDFSVSRARVRWGIPVPEQPDHVLYVWIDALSNYITALGFADEGESYRRFWAGADERQHLIGKDIIRFHCLYWPAVLHAAGLPVPTREFAQGFITKDGRKLSKTTGNIIDPVALAERFGPDAARYFLLREAPYGADWDFTDSAFLGRYNADLANDLGNLVSRALTMATKYCDGTVPARADAPSGSGREFEKRLQADAPVAWPYAEGLRNGVLARYEASDFSGALGEVWSWISRLNQRIVAVEPWKLAREPARRPDLEAFLYRLLEGVRLVAVLASPVVPRAAGRVFAMLGLGEREPDRDDLEWGRLEPGKPLGDVVALFPRVESRKESTVSDTTPTPPAAEKPGTAGPGPAGGPGDERIGIADFAKVRLAAAKVTAAERIEGSKKLLKLQVDLGAEQRQVVAGIAQTHAPEDLVGKTVVLVANLEPAKLMGVESNGMVLAGSVDGKAVLCSFEAEVEPGPGCGEPHCRRGPRGAPRPRGGSGPGREARERMSERPGWIILLAAVWLLGGDGRPCRAQAAQTPAPVAEDEGIEAMQRRIVGVVEAIIDYTRDVRLSEAGLESVLAHHGSLIDLHGEGNSSRLVERAFVDGRYDFDALVSDPTYVAWSRERGLDPGGFFRELLRLQALRMREESLGSLDAARQEMPQQRVALGKMREQMGERNYRDALAGLEAAAGMVDETRALMEGLPVPSSEEKALLSRYDERIREILGEVPG